MKNFTLLSFFIPICFLFQPLLSNAQLYEQQFTTDMAAVPNGPVTDANYVGTPATNAQLTYLGTNTAGSNSITATGGSLQIVTSSTGSTWGAVRNDNFSGPPSALKVTFDASINVGSSGSNHKFFFYVGTGFTNAIGTEAAANIHSGFSIRYANSAYYYVKTLAGTGGETVTDRVADNTSLSFTFVTNNTGGALNYLAPDGSTESIADDTWDLWIGTVKKLDDQAATTPGQTLDQVKFGDFTTSSGGRANWTLDNVLINPLTPIVPVKLEYFKGRKTTAGNAINWKVTCLSTNITMDIERATDGRNFKSIRSIAATQERCNQPFDFTDNRPAGNINYYRLRMTDIDGKISYSPTVVIISGDKGIEIAGLYPSVVSNETFLNVASARTTTMVTSITDMNGKLIKTSTQVVPEGSSLVRIDCSNLTTGVYYLSGIADGLPTKTIRFVKL